MGHRGSLGTSETHRDYIQRDDRQIDRQPDGDRQRQLGQRQADRQRQIEYGLYHNEVTKEHRKDFVSFHFSNTDSEHADALSGLR